MLKISQISSFSRHVFLKFLQGILVRKVDRAKPIINLKWAKCSRDCYKNRISIINLIYFASFSSSMVYILLLPAYCSRSNVGWRRQIIKIKKALLLLVSAKHTFFSHSLTRINECSLRQLKINFPIFTDSLFSVMMLL